MTSAVQTGFGINIPESWFEIDVHPDTRNTAISAMVSERTRAVPELVPHRATLTRLLRGLARTAHANGAAFCGVMAEGFDGAVLTGSITVTIVRPPGNEVDAAEIRHHLSAKARTGDPEAPWRDVVQAAMPYIAGTVPRTQGIEDVALPDAEGWVRSVVMQTYVPFPGPNPEWVALITGSSTMLPLADDLLELFDAITGSFRFVDAE
ncbi:MULTISPECIES: hypothetical protein [Actinoplanes]|uniref:hypothetical protein n=1 Tax=Actinoplanes TaxID=1865 RepID=UPI0005F2C452|nr:MULTISPECIES: hypothetical protein [Actinoplanes]GLY08167.1 hypothetical protein Acsp01_85460 [Actinoplanes sp. NBRC 101535]